MSSGSRDSCVAEVDRMVLLGPTFSSWMSKGSRRALGLLRLGGWLFARGVKGCGFDCLGAGGFGERWCPCAVTHRGIIC